MAATRANDSRSSVIETTDQHAQQPNPSESFLARAYRTLGPLAGGLILDTADLATLTPVSPLLGPVVGGLIGWWLAGFHRFRPATRLLMAVASGIYCALPFTEVIPVATIIAACARWRQTERERA